MLDVFWFNYCKFLIWLVGYDKVLMKKVLGGVAIYRLKRERNLLFIRDRLLEWQVGEFDELENWLANKPIMIIKGD